MSKQPIPAMEHILNELEAALQALQHTAPALPFTDDDRAFAQELAHRARLQAATQSILLAIALLRTPDPADSPAIQREAITLTQRIQRWATMSRGWYEDRMIKRQQVLTIRHSDGTVTQNPVERVYGPYRYFHWYDDQGKRQTAYLGITPGAARPASTDSDSPPADGE